MTIEALSDAFSDDGGHGEGASRIPQDLHAEQSVLGAMLLNSDAIADCLATGLKAHDFYRPAHELIFDAILDLYGHGEPADAITVADHLTKRGDLTRIGGQAYLHQLIQSVVTWANADFYAKIVGEQATLRRLVQAGHRLIAMGEGQGEGDVDDIVNRAQAEVYGVSQREDQQDYRSMAQLLDPLMERIEANAQRGGAINGIPTGISDLDDCLHGLKPGQLIVIAARPAVGKSVLGIQIARHAAVKHNIPSGVWSLEMSGEEIGLRIASAEGTIDLTALEHGLKKQKDWDKLAAIMARLAEAPLFIDDSPNMTLVDIRAKARRLRQQSNLSLIVIDYLQLLTSGKRVESRQQEVAEFSRALKLLAKELEVPVIAISQLNRGPEQRADKRPSMADIRESGAVEQDADVVILLHRDRDDPEKEGEAEIIVAKHRNGPTKDVAVAFQGHYARFADMAKDGGF